jgi:predicted RNA-binding protein with RPS1 domain
METKFDIAGGKKGCAFLHISQIRDLKVKDVSDVLKVGQQIDNARVITIDHEKKEVAISLRKRRQARKDLSQYNVGDAFKGRVKSIASYGAFIDVGGKSNALLHISRISENKVNDITDFIAVGQKIDIHLIDVDHDKKTMACSMLDTQADEYVDRRTQQKERRQNLVNKVARGQLQDNEVEEIQNQLTLFEDAIRDLNTAFSEAPDDGTELLGYYTQSNQDTATS